MIVLWNVTLMSVAVFVVAKMMPGIHSKNFITALMVAGIYSIINFLLGWILVILSLPFLLITLGLFKFVINAFMLWLTDKFVDDFKIDGLGTTLVAAVAITVISTLLKWVF